MPEQELFYYRVNKLDNSLTKHRVINVGGIKLTYIASDGKQTVEHQLSSHVIWFKTLEKAKLNLSGTLYNSYQRLIADRDEAIKKVNDMEAYIEVVNGINDETISTYA